MKTSLKLMLPLLGIFQGSIAYANVESALNDSFIGLYPHNEFRLNQGACIDCEIPKQTLWYFSGEVIAIPTNPKTVAGFSNQLPAQKDVLAWSSENNADANLPAAIWLGSSKSIEHARVQPDRQILRLSNGAELSFETVPKISTNLSYLNQSSWDFFEQRNLRLRGEIDGSGKFTARTIWPEDYRVTSDHPSPLASNETLQQLVQAHDGGAQTPYATRVLWQRKSAENNTNWEGKATLGIMLNGAQGDDDEAHGGHFAILTGRVGKDGDWSQWLVNNYYNLDAYGEKGIIAGITPADKYLMDLNSGQSMYRPSYMLVAILKTPDLASKYQAATNRVYQHFYRHDFTYDHSAANCAGISIDTFRTLGWDIPKQGVEGYLKAIAAWFYVAYSERSLNAGRKIYDYLTEEKSRLYPAVTFDAIGNDLLKLVNNPTLASTPYEKAIANDVEAIVYVHIPQTPSERAWGLAPVYSFDQYLMQAPADRKNWKILPTTPRPFPDDLKDGLALEHHDRLPIPWPVGLVIAVLISVFISAIRWLITKAK